MLLGALGLKFKTAIANADEADFFGSTVRETVEENARRKATTLLPGIAPGDVLITADTLVAMDGRVMSKPKDRDEALAHLRAFSGGTHEVLTGMALSSRTKPQRVSCTSTLVSFRHLSQAEIEAYADSPEPYDKAGGYGIQGIACLFVSKVEGSYSNVMGLPTETLLRELEAYTGITPADWLKK